MQVQKQMQKQVLHFAQDGGSCLGWGESKRKNTDGFCDSHLDRQSRAMKVGHPNLS